MVLQTLNPEHVRKLVELINQAPYFKLLSMVIKELGPGFCRVALDLENKHLNPFGGVHGGVYSSLVDTAAYWAVYGDVAEDAGLISLDVEVDMLAPIKEGGLLVEGKRIKVGRQVCIAEALILDHKGKILAHGTSKQLLIPGLQTIAQALASMGCEALPPKFA